MPKPCRWHHKPLLREKMNEAGYPAAEAVRARSDAKAAGYTETDELGRDRLNESRRKRGVHYRPETNGVT